MSEVQKQFSIEDELPSEYQRKIDRFYGCSTKEEAEELRSYLKKIGCTKKKRKMILKKMLPQGLFLQFYPQEMERQERKKSTSSSVRYESELSGFYFEKYASPQITPPRKEQQKIVHVISSKPSQIEINLEKRRNARFEEVLQRIAEDRLRRGVKVPVNGLVERNPKFIDTKERARAKMAQEWITICKSKKNSLREDMSCDGKLKIDSKHPTIHFVKKR